jgi:phosphoribosylformylglycinamidine synthase
MEPIILRGTSAFSDVHTAALKARALRLTPPLAVARFEAVWVYLLDAVGPLDPSTWAKTLALLSASGVHDDSGEGFYVTPRKGTISPWSSKATDIFRNCGIEPVRRVERGLWLTVWATPKAYLPIAALGPLLPLLHDRMTQGVYRDVRDIFFHRPPAPLREIEVMTAGRGALERANLELGLALNDGEIAYLYNSYLAMGRNPTDVELVMFGQVNSEHCRHKIFRASWVVDGEAQPESLFDMIRHTHRAHPEGTLSAYRDNSAVIEGFPGQWFEPDPRAAYAYRYTPAQMDVMIKVETHNHPTAISPFPGAATGVGGEIRDEGATGSGARSKAGLCGFMVSNLNLPDFVMPWERPLAPFPTRLATPLEIMTEGPLGGAGFGNEYGRPQLCGFFKTYEEVYNGRYWGYHKPIMLAGGMGNIRREHTRKRAIPAGACVVQLGGPAMRIGLGGGAASSMDTGSNAEDLDFDSVQRDNAEMQRRCQEVISACIARGDQNPILSIHDIGAGGLSNGCPELVEEVGARFALRQVPNEEPSMSPMEIWCCEAQERYVLAVVQEDLDPFLEICRRERCPAAVIGQTTGDQRLVLHDGHFGNTPIDLDLHVLLGKPPGMVRDVRRRREPHAPLDLAGVELREAARRVLHLPAVANKTFLITIADRSITGMVARDQMVGPYQTPIADAAVTASAYSGYTGEAMAVGERTRIAMVDAPASGRMAVAEALLNLVGADIGPIGNVKLSANWMAACAEAGEDANLFDTVHSVGRDICPRLGVCIPVGKDSLSMRTVWQSTTGQAHKQVAPVSLCVSAFAPVRDVRKTVTADLKRVTASTLLLVDLGHGRNRLGGASALAQVYNQVGAEVPDMDSPEEFRDLFGAVQELVRRGLLLACHDRSDGGLFVTLCEMAFAARTGLCCDLSGLAGADLPVLFAEELGLVLQVADDRCAEVEATLGAAGLAAVTHRLGRLAADGRVTFVRHGRALLSEPLTVLQQWWSELTYRMQARRDDPECAREEFEALADDSDPGMTFHLSFDPAKPFTVTTGARPRLAVLREQGINGQVEMAAAFDRAGFQSVDVHMTDLLGGRADLAHFAGLVACGGFSYGDVLGAGAGWARSILFNAQVREMFARFFARPDTFTLGVCNGCQMVSQLKEIIPGAAHWPTFTRNRCARFEARYVTVEILPSPAVVLRGMEGSRLGIPVAHGEGFANFTSTGSEGDSLSNRLVAMRFVDNRGLACERYPLNPNGSPGGITGLTTTDGRVTIMMPHPERAFRRLQLSYAPPQWQCEEGPWLRLFQNARTFAG